MRGRLSELIVPSDPSKPASLEGEAPAEPRLERRRNRPCGPQGSRANGLTLCNRTCSVGIGIPQTVGMDMFVAKIRTDRLEFHSSARLSRSFALQNCRF
jgi:hypothetical protein